MKKITARILTLLIVMLMILFMSSSLTFAYTAAGLKASMQNANLLPNPTDRAERAARGNYLPYTGYFEESFTIGGAECRFDGFF